MVKKKGLDFDTMKISIEKERLILKNCLNLF